MARPALAILGKDLRQRVRDRSAFLVAVVAPLTLALVFGMTLSGVSSDDLELSFGVVDLDGGVVATGFTDEVLAGLERDGLATLTVVRTVGEGRRLAADGDVAATFVLPAGLSEAVGAGRPARIEVIGDVDQPIGVLVARSIADTFAAELEATQVAVGAALAAGATGSVDALAGRARELAPPIVIEDATATKKQLDPVTFYSASMAVFFLFFTVQFGLSTLLDERRQGTLGRLLVAPVSRRAILLGKALTSIVMGLASMTVLVVSTSLIVGAEWGSPAGVALLVAAGVLAATALSALVISFARTPEQAGNFQSIVALVFGLLGGVFFPIAAIGGWLERVSLATPHAWFLRGLGDLAGGAGPGAVLGAVAAILAFAAVFGAFAVARSARLVEP